MFELKPYTRKNNGVYYNPFQTMATATPFRRICPASIRRISTSTLTMTC